MDRDQVYIPPSISQVVQDFRNTCTESCYHHVRLGETIFEYYCAHTATAVSDNENILLANICLQKLQAASSCYNEDSLVYMKILSFLIPFNIIQCSLLDCENTLIPSFIQCACHQSDPTPFFNEILNIMLNLILCHQNQVTLMLMLLPFLYFAQVVYIICSFQQAGVVWMHPTAVQSLWIYLWTLLMGSSSSLLVLTYKDTHGVIGTSLASHPSKLFIRRTAGPCVVFHQSCAPLTWYFKHISGILGRHRESGECAWSGCIRDTTQCDASR